MNAVPKIAPHFPAIHIQVDHLTAEAAATNRNVGFIEIGQRAAVTVDAFNYMRYGSIEGRIVSLSADAVVPRTRTMPRVRRAQPRPARKRPRKCCPTRRGSKSNGNI